MLVFTALLGALLGGLVLLDPPGAEEPDDAPPGPDEDARGGGDLLDVPAPGDVSGDVPDLAGDPPRPPVDDTELVRRGAATEAPPADPDPPAAPAEGDPDPDPAPDLGPDGVDVVPGEHLTDGRGGSLLGDLGLRDDPLLGTAGADTLAGSAAGDLAMGNEGDDTLSGGAGRDHLDGGHGADSLRGGAEGDALMGGGGDDTLRGDGGDDLLSGEDGDDVLLGGDGADRLFGGAGSDTLEGGAGADLLDGTFHDGGAPDGADLLRGGAGDDTLGIGAGDEGWGGAGADLAIFAGPGLGALSPDPGAPLPRLMDFDPEGDRIELIAGDEGGTLDTRPENGGLTLLLDGTAVAWIAGVDAIDPALIRVVAE